VTPATTDDDGRYQVLFLNPGPYVLTAEKQGFQRSVQEGLTLQVAERATLDVKLGETVRFVVANKGAAMHELVLGTPKDIAQHAQAMAKSPAGMAHHDHQVPSMVHVHPGGTGEIVWRFNRAGTFAYACLIPGHYEAGMKGTLVVK
jgi:uncharacterized cupredoxin-like copper-binding protein